MFQFAPFVPSFYIAASLGALLIFNMAKSPKLKTEAVKEVLSEHDVRLLYDEWIDKPILNSMIANLGVEQTDKLLSKFTDSMGDSMGVKKEKGCMDCKKPYLVEHEMKPVQSFIEFLKGRKKNEGIKQVIEDCGRFSDQVDHLAIFSDAILPVWKQNDDIKYKQAIDDVNLKGYYAMIGFYLNHFLTSSERDKLAEQVIKTSSELLVGDTSMSTMAISQASCTQALLLLVLHSVLADFISTGYAMEINRAARREAIVEWSNGQAMGDLPEVMEASLVDTPLYYDEEPYFARDLMY